MGRKSLIGTGRGKLRGLETWLGTELKDGKCVYVCVCVCVGVCVCVCVCGCVGVWVWVCVCMCVSRGRSTSYVIMKPSIVLIV